MAEVEYSGGDPRPPRELEPDPSERRTFEVDGEDWIAWVAGKGAVRISVEHILPNLANILIVQGTIQFSLGILAEAGLSYVGLGAQPPTPEWGTMLAEARQFILRAWWVVTFPGLAILVTVLSINLVGDGLRDALDPKLKRS